MKLRVVYCNEYYGYTLNAWLAEVKELLEKELCSKIEILEPERVEEGCSEPVYLEVDGHIVLEGLPGEEGYLIEVLKSLLSRC